GRAVESPRLVFRQTPHERIAIGMNAGAGEAEQNVAGRDLLARQLLAAFNRADAEAGEVVIARRVHTRHLCGFAADQRTSGLLAALSDTRDHSFGHARIELAGCEIV